LEYKAGVADHFAVLFDSDGDGKDAFSKKWGWYPILYSLAGESYLEMDAVTRTPVGHLFTHLAFLKDLEAKRKQAVQR
jgi:hypothetical protein